MKEVHSFLEHEIKKLPYKLLEGIIARKLTAAGIKNSEEISPRVLEHALAGTLENFSWDDGSTSDRTIKISITDEDLAELENEFSRFLKDTLPEIIADTSKKTAVSTLRSLKKQWPEQRAWEENSLLAFRNNLEARWGRALDLLRMLLTISREIGAEWHNRTLRRKKSNLREALFRIHVRSCQISAEIITLLENGYADGALARWRTLHEVCMVGLLLSEHGEPLAERYLAHRIVEAHRAAEEYSRNYLALGFKPISKRERMMIERNYKRALAKFGKEFGSQYGWASHHLKMKKPTFSDIERAVGVSSMRSFYKMASYNVHATAQGMFFKLGLMDSSGVIAGASNAGLTDPGQNTAVTLSVITTLLFGPRYRFEDVLALHVLKLLQDEIPMVFWRADLKLRRDHKQHSRESTKNPKVRQK